MGSASLYPGDRVRDHDSFSPATSSRDVALRKMAGSGLPGRPRRTLSLPYDRVE
jgi:hypothetical protein